MLFRQVSSSFSKSFAATELLKVYISTGRVGFDAKMLQELIFKAFLMYRLVYITVLVFKEYKAGKLVCEKYTYLVYLSV